MKGRLLLFCLLILSFRVYSQSCTLTVSLTASNTSICSGNPVILTASASAGTPGYTYIWNTGETTQSIIVNKAGTYKVTVSDQSTCPPVSKSIIITSGTTPPAPTAPNVVACPNGPATLTATAPGGTYQWYDAATGGTLLFTGSSYTTPVLTATTTYYVQTISASGCTSARTAVTVMPTPGPTATGGSTCAGSDVLLTASGADTYKWYATIGGTAIASGPTYDTPSLFATTTYYVTGTTNGCVSSPVAVTALVLPVPTPPAASAVTTCYGSSATLSASSIYNNAVFDWFDVPTGGISLITGPNYTTPALTANKTYYVQVTVNSCVSTRTPVTVTVNPIPVNPTATPDTICAGNMATLKATAPAGVTYQWFAKSTDNNVLSNSDTFVTPVLNRSTTYYVQTIQNGCGSARVAVNVIVNTAPAAPSVSGQTICWGTAATITPIAPAGTYTWYDAATGGTLLFTGSSYTTPVLTATTTYYVQTISASGCSSTRTPVVVTVSAAIPAPTAIGVTICSGSVATLTASGGASYEWYDSPTGGTRLATTRTFVTPALTSSFAYYVQAVSNGCASPRTVVVVDINPLPAAPTASGTTVCYNNPATLTATPPSGTTRWYSAATGGTSLYTGNTYTTPALKNTTIYYIETLDGTCVSAARNAVTVTVQNQNQFQYSSGTYCTSSTLNQTPTIIVPGGTFSATPGLTIDPATGEISNIAGTTVGNYTVSYVGPCSTTTAIISIVGTPDASFSYSGPAFCQDGTNPAPIFAPAQSAGVFSSTAGLVFASPTSGIIDLSDSQPGTYTVTNTINSTGCTASIKMTTVTIDPAVVISAGPAQTVGAGTTVQLAGTVSNAPGATWSGGAGSFSDPNDLNATYIPSAAENTAGSVTLTLTSAPTGNSCGPKTSTVVITINPVPAAPTATGTTTCAGTPATVSATAPGGTYDWFDVSTGGTSLKTGRFFTTTLTATTTYYVQTTVNGVASNRTPVIITVNDIPTPPITSGVTTCYGSTATLTASGSTGTYDWYDASVGGNRVGTGSSFTSLALTADYVYYVQTTVNGCVSDRSSAYVTVNTLPNVTSGASDFVCSGTALNYTMTADIPGTQFAWDRDDVSGISNPGSFGNVSNSITEALINTTDTSINVTYVISSLVNGCNGIPFNYVVTVNPIPHVTSADSVTICSDNSPDYTITFNTSSTNFTWSRAAIAGISNAAISGQASSQIQELLHNTTNAPVNVTYVINYDAGGCPGTPFNLIVTVNPDVSITSAQTGEICSGTPQNYTITSNVPTATYSWSHDAVPGVTNAAASGTTMGLINETLINTSGADVTVIYVINTAANGCLSDYFNYAVTVHSQPPTPVVNSNSPVCTASTIRLFTPTNVAGSTYLWQGPNGFTSSLQNPVITNVTTASAGAYTLYIISAKGCTSLGATVNVAVDVLPIANAGPDQVMCKTAPFVQLAGNVSGGTTTGIWSTSGTGTFSPSANQLTGEYIPSAADRAAGSVTLTLVSTSKDDCTIATDNTTIKFQLTPASDAGPDQSVCSQSTAVQLNGKILIAGDGIWSTSGTGTFAPSATQVNGGVSPVYVPGAADITAGKVTLTLMANSATSCNSPADQMVISFIPPPKVNAGGTVYVLQGKTVVLKPTVSDNNVTYLWTPNIGIDNNTVKNPTITGDVDRIYTLQVTDSRGCVSTDQVMVKISPQIIIPNTFTPNGDGINDLWDIQGLIAYADATVDVYNRYGTRVFHSIGYGKPWDGTYNGQLVPFGTYYYVINAKVYSKAFSGYVTVVR
jgi:gliding motility-associated-like protein